MPNHRIIELATLFAHALDNFDVRIMLEKGQPRGLIPAAVEKHKIDVLVMGTVSRTGLPGVLIGNTAEKILNPLSCSVVTVKPKGFVSPIVQAESERSGIKSKAPLGAPVGTRRAAYVSPMNQNLLLEYGCTCLVGN